MLLSTMFTTRVGRKYIGGRASAFSSPCTTTRAYNHVTTARNAANRSAPVMRIYSVCLKTRTLPPVKREQKNDFHSNVSVSYYLYRISADSGIVAVLYTGISVLQTVAVPSSTGALVALLYTSIFESGIHSSAVLGKQLLALDSTILAQRSTRV